MAPSNVDEEKFAQDPRTTHYHTPTGVELSRREHKSMERTNSISITTGPTQVNPGVRLPADFRTLRWVIFMVVLLNYILIAAPSVFMSQTRIRVESNRRVARTRRISQVRSVRSPKCSLTFDSDLSTLEWHSLPAVEVCTRLGVSPKRGLDGPMASRRLSKYGRNAITPPPKRWFWKIFKYIFGGEFLNLLLFEYIGINFVRIWWSFAGRQYHLFCRMVHQVCPVLGSVC